MEADFAVELGADDETLELPWAADDGGPRYYDLKRQPELLLELEEARRAPELAEFLAAMNSPAGILETAKCDTWSSTEINPEEEIFGAAYKFGSYVDMLFSQETSRCSFAEHEQFAKRITQLLKRVPEIPAAAELLIRRCFYHVGGETREGFYITFYLFGYGDDEAQARQRWAIALKLVENAIRQEWSDDGVRMPSAPSAAVLVRGHPGPQPGFPADGRGRPSSISVRLAFHRVRKIDSSSIARKIAASPSDAARMPAACLGTIESRPYTNSMCTQ